tara:strand:- start:284 stop:553 length:270 start_codon:yes stop_codon:yes gene_type:complete
VQDDSTNLKENNMDHRDPMQTSPRRLYRIKQVLEVIPVSKTTWWNGVRHGRFPKPIRNGRMTFWKSEDIETFIDALNSADLAELKANSK